jgi:NADPH:quinone reductase-like Zn-dependent oxidoreductase
VAIAPSNLSHKESAALPYGGLLALHCLHKANIQTRRRVLVYGASGSIGTAAVQLAKHFGARVDAVCSGANVQLVADLGAETVFDYTTRQDVGEERYDLVFDAVGRRKTSALKVASMRALTPGGSYLSIDDGLPRPTRADLQLLASLAEAGTLRPVIDRTFPLERIADAHRYAEQGHVRGNVIIGTH